MGALLMILAKGVVLMPHASVAKPCDSSQVIEN